MNSNIKLLVLAIAFISLSCGKDYDEEILASEEEPVAQQTSETESNEEDENEKTDSSTGEDKDGETSKTEDLDENQNNDDGNTDIEDSGNEENSDVPDNGSTSEEDKESTEENDKKDDGSLDADNENGNSEKNDTLDLASDFDISSHDIKKIMDLDCPSGWSAQGSANFDDFLFQFYAGNRYFSVYDINNKKKIGDYLCPGPLGPRVHANTVNFSSRYYNSDDPFPTLYLSSGYQLDGYTRIYCYRVIHPSELQYRLELVQTITLQDFGTWTEGVLDNENGYLWIKYEKNGSNGSYGYAKYEIPDYSSDDVIISFNDYLEKFDLPAQPKPSSNQGHIFQGGKIRLVSGVPSKDQPLLYICLNPSTGERELMIDLSEQGLVNENNRKDNAYEPEGCMVYDGQFLICYKNFVYSISLDDI